MPSLVKHVLIPIFIISCGIGTVRSVTEEECGFIGAPDSAAVVRTCTYVRNEEVSNEESICVPSQEWMEGAFLNSDIMPLLSQCVTSEFSICPPRNLSECITDYTESHCMTSPFLVSSELLEGMVNTYPQLRKEVLDLPAVCAAFGNNISCTSEPSCRWAPFEYQYGINGDIVMELDVKDLVIEGLESQGFDFGEAVPSSEFSRMESVVEFEAFDADLSVLSILIEVEEEGDNSLRYQLAYLDEPQPSSFYGFDTETSFMKDEIGTILTLARVNNQVVVRRIPYKQGVVLYEIEFSSEEIASGFLLQEVSSDIGDSRVHFFKHALNTQRITVNQTSENFDFSVLYFGDGEVFDSERIVTISSEMTSEDIVDQFGSIDLVLFAFVEITESEVAVFFDIKFVSRLEGSLASGSGTEGIMYPNEFLLRVVSEDSFYEIGYLKKNPGIMMSSIINFKLCAYDRKYSGLAEPRLGTRIVPFFGYERIEQLVPSVGDPILLDGSTYYAKRIIMGDLNDPIAQNLSKVYEIEIDRPYRGNQRQGMMEVFTCSWIDSRKVKYSDDTLMFQDTLGDLYSANAGILSVVLSENEANVITGVLRSFDMVVTGSGGIRMVFPEVWNCPMSRLAECTSSNVVWNNVHARTSFSTREFPSMQLMFGGYLQSDDEILRLRADGFGTLSSAGATCFSKSSSNNMDLGSSVACEKENFLLEFELGVICISEPFNATGVEDLRRAIDSLCNLREAHVDQIRNNSSPQYRVTFREVPAEEIKNPFALLVAGAANVPQMLINIREGFEGMRLDVDYYTVVQGKGTLLSAEQGLPYERYVGDDQERPCITSLEDRKVRLNKLRITDAEEIGSLQLLDEEMYICAGRNYELYRLRQAGNNIALNAVEGPPEPMTQESCLAISLGVDGTDLSSRECVWRGRGEGNLTVNPLLWSEASYRGLSAEVIYSPCTVPIKIVTRRLLRLYRLFTEPDELEIPGYDKDLGTSIKKQINDYLNQYGRCSTFQDDTRLTSVFTRSWQLIVTHCLYVCSGVYGVAGCRVVFVINAARGEDWTIGVSSFKRLLGSLLFVFVYMMLGTLKVGLVFCIPAAVLAKLIGSESIRESILMSLGHTSALMILYLDLGFHIREK